MDQIVVRMIEIGIAPKAGIFLKKIMRLLSEKSLRCMTTAGEGAVAA